MRRLLGRHLPSFYLKDLAPEDGIDLDYRRTTYYRCLKTALSKNRIRNIALTGHYGCGKSTILKTFEKHFGNRHRFLFVSLATFGKDIATANVNFLDGGNTTRQQRLSYLVEHSILQQIIYQVPKSAIPRSRFKRITRGRLTLFAFLGFLIWLICLGCAVAVIRPLTYENIVVIRSLLQNMPVRGNTWLSIVGMGTALIPAYLIIRLLNSVTLRKLNLKSCEIEIAEDKDPSVLNKHLDEILYFFEATSFDVVVFEDLDRFDTPDIFTKLREINTLINQNAEARPRSRSLFARRRKLTFIYAIRDHMFTGEERTKFFDLIIPVVPVVNYINSRDILRAELNKRCPALPYEIPELLLADIARYVPDMRLLYNIVNEFAVYRERLNMEGLRDASLLAMMVYKNIFPKDFADLQDRRGLLYEYFKRKPDYRNQRIPKIRADISANRELLSLAEAGTEKSLEELRILYAVRLQKVSVKDKPGWFPFAIRIGNKWQPFHAIVKEETFEDLASAKQVPVKIARTNGNTDQVNANFEKEWSATGEQQSYDARKQAILLRDRASQDAMEKEIVLLQEIIAKIKNAKLAQILEAGHLAPLDAGPYLPDDDEIACERKGRLLHLLLRQGYIDETYESYLSYFYEGTLTNQDRVFVMSVKNATPLDPDYQLTNVPEIVDRQLTPHEAIVQSTRNIFILDHMIDTPSLQDVVKTMKEEPGQATSLLTLHLRTSCLRHALLIRHVYNAWPALWNVVRRSADLSPSERDLHLAGIIMHAGNELLEIICTETSFREYISDRNDFVDYAQSLGAEKRVASFLKTVRPEFTGIAQLPDGSGIASLIYDQGMYAVNVPMIALMYRTFVGKCPDDLPPTISSILVTGSDPLRKRVEEQLETYLAELLQLTDALKRETEDTVVWLLSNGTISHKIRQELASGPCRPVTRLEDVEQDDAIWGRLLESAAVVPSWENVWAYLCAVANDTLDEALIAFLSLDSVVRTLSHQSIDNSYLTGKKDAPNLATLLLSSPRLEMKTAAQLVQAIPRDYTVQDLSLLRADFLPLIIDRKQVQFTADNYNYVREKCADSLGEFVKNNRYAFLAHVSDMEVDGEDLKAMLSSHQRRKQKKEIAEAVLGKGIPEGIEAVADELCQLMLHYETFVESLDLEAVSTILAAAQDRALKIKALTLTVGSLQDKHISAVLSSISGDYGKLVEHGSRPTFKNSALIKDLAVALRDRGYVSSFKESGNTIRISTYSGDRSTETETDATP